MLPGSYQLASCPQFTLRLLLFSGTNREGGANSGLEMRAWVVLETWGVPTTGPLYRVFQLEKAVDLGNCGDAGAAAPSRFCRLNGDHTVALVGAERGIPRAFDRLLLDARRHGGTGAGPVFRGVRWEEGDRVISISRAPGQNGRRDGGQRE
jgi:hypothetical protein